HRHMLDDRSLKASVCCEEEREEQKHETDGELGGEAHDGVPPEALRRRGADVLEPPHAAYWPSRSSRTTIPWSRWTTRRRSALTISALCVAISSVVPSSLTR